MPDNRSGKSSMLPCLLAAVVLAGLASSLGAPGVQAEEFRVENRIYIGSEKEPRSESTTIFHEGVVYDYLLKPAEITVFDKPHGRFVLLDTGRRVKTVLSLDEISALNKNLKDWALSQNDAFLQFLAEPKFEEQFDESTGALTFNSPWLTYQVAPGDTESDAIVRQYREFSDWYTLLNTRLNPGSRLPYARLLLNEAMEKRRQVPREVHLTMRSKRGLLSQKTVIRSEHELVRVLVQSDRDRVRQTDEFMAMFRSVDFHEYQKMEP